MSDTTTEAVERLVERMRADAAASDAARYQPYTDGMMRNAAATLIALAKQRDAAVADEVQHSAAVNRAEAERDAALAREAVLLEELKALRGASK